MVESKMCAMCGKTQGVVVCRGCLANQDTMQIENAAAGVLCLSCTGHILTKKGSGWVVTGEREITHTKRPDYKPSDELYLTGDEELT